MEDLFLVLIKESWVTIHKADKPNFISDLSYSNMSTLEKGKINSQFFGANTQHYSD